jgi:hypothetical protein
MQLAARRLISFAKSRGLTVRIDSTRRSCAEQAAIYAQGRTAPGQVVTQVKGCGSYHVLGRAIDIFVGTWNCADYEELGRYWESIGGRWGGRFSFRDCVHFELPHPNLELSVLCPPGIDCETAVKLQPGAFGPLAVALSGAAVGLAVGLVLSR